jgi:uncharacterized Zn-binding protein involved in type VI secretion
MPTGPAARTTDNVAHPLPPMLSPGPGSPNVIIGMLPAWRGIPLAAAAALQSAKAAADIAVQTAVAATAAATGPAMPAAYAAEQAVKASVLSSMSSAISSASAGADIHVCATPSPVPPHGPGVVINGSATVMINNLPACRLGDTIMEALGSPEFDCQRRNDGNHRRLKDVDKQDILAKQVGMQHFWLKVSGIAALTIHPVVVSVQNLIGLR